MPGVYTAARSQLLAAGINFQTADIRALLIDSADESYNAADTFLTDVTTAGIVSGPTALANKTVANGAFDADDIAFTSVVGDSVEAVILYVHTGNPSTARLVSYHDLGTSVQPNSGNIIIQWSPSGIITTAG